MRLMMGMMTSIFQRMLCMY